MKAPPADAGLVHDFRVIRRAQRVQVGGELAEHFAQHLLRGHRHRHVGAQARWPGAQRQLQCALQQGVTALGLADVQRQHRQRAGDLLRHLEQCSRRPGQQFELQLANRRAFAARRDLPDVQRHLDDAAAAPPHLPKGAREGGDKTRRKRPKQRAVRVQVLPRRGVKRPPGQLRAGHANFPFAALAQRRVAAAAHLQGLQPLRLGFAALAPQPQGDALLVQVLLGRVEVNVVQMKLHGLAARQHGRARQ